MRKILLISLILLVTAGAQAQIKSVYTSLAAKACKPTAKSSDDGYEGICPGVGGYKLLAMEGDLRQNIHVIAPGGKKFDLNFWGFYGNFSSVGEKAEWRVKAGKPIALIARYNVSNAEDSSKITSYLLVSKISRTQSCVVKFVEPGPNQNATARKFADTAANMSCLEPE